MKVNSKSFFLHFDLMNNGSIENLCSALIEIGASTAFLRSILEPLIIEIKDKKILISYCNNKKDTLKFIINKLNPVSKILVTKTISLLKEIKHPLSYLEHTYIVVFFSLIETLNPQFITASAIPLPPTSPHPILLQSILTFESTQIRLYDAVYLAILKSCVSKFGPRQLSTIIKTSSPNYNDIVLQCLSIPISTQANNTNKSLLFCIYASLFPTSLQTFPTFIETLRHNGALSIESWNSNTQALKFSIQLRMISSKYYKSKILETLLKSSFVENIFFHPIEGISSNLKK